MSAWGDSFGASGSGADVEILVDAIRTAEIISAVSASITDETLTADSIETTSCSVATETMSADIETTYEASI